MKCPKCGFDRMKGYQPVTQEKGILQQGYLCPICGKWIEPKITPLKPVPEKFPLSEEHRLKCAEGLAKARQIKKEKKNERQ